MQAYLFRNGRNESLVVRDNDNTPVPILDRVHEGIETLDIEMVSRLCTHRYDQSHMSSSIHLWSSTNLIEKEDVRVLER